VSIEGRKVTVLFGERDRVGGRFLAEHVIDEFERAGLHAAILMRGVEGFGPKHRLRTDRLLTLSEDLPIVAVGAGEPSAADTVADRIGSLPFDGLVITERILLTEARAAGAAAPDGRSKLSAYVGRSRRVDGRPAHRWLVERLRAAGAEGAGVLLGVDGLLGGRRRRAGFFARNVDVPALVVSVGRPEVLAAVAGDCGRLAPDSVVTLERAHVCKRDGGPLSPPPPVASPAEGGMWRKLTLYASEQDRAGDRPIHVEAVRRLREAGAAGATALRGTWGFDGSRPPHGDTLRSLRRNVPTLTVVIDEPEPSERWLAILDELTPVRGVITSELVPAIRPHP
jgi:PII-like signaling protein